MRVRILAQGRLCVVMLAALLSACGNAATTAATGGPDDVAVADVADVALATDVTAGCGADQFLDPATEACVDRPAESAAAADRAACKFTAGSLAAGAVGKEWPAGDAIPIQHFVIVMMENRSFDHYFGAGKQFGLDVDGFPENASNPDAKGVAVPVFHATDACIKDVAHGWTQVHKQVNGGKMDGFVTTNDPNGQRALGYFDGSDLAFYYDVAKTFGLSDNHHCAVLGPTWVNRLFFISATSFGLTANQMPPAAAMDAHPDQVILAQLDKKNVDWRVYKTDLSEFMLNPNYMGVEANQSRLKSIDDFFVDAAAGTLPAVSYVQPTFATSGGARNDEHPPGTPYQGEQFTHQVLSALMASPNWKDAVYIQTYDEHGGFYDHAVPPPACAPDDTPPKLGPADTQVGFTQMGIRVPLLVASPWSKPGYVSHMATDNTSVLRLLELRFGLPAMSARDANAWPMLDFFDFSKRSFETPPKLAEPKPMTAEIEACVKKF